MAGPETRPTAVSADSFASSIASTDGSSAGTSPAARDTALPTGEKTACLACRKRKIRCDRQYPCAACRASGVACGFLATGRARSRQKVLQKLRRAPVEEQIEMSRRQQPGHLSHLHHDGSTAALDTTLLTRPLLFHCTAAFLERCHPINLAFVGGAGERAFRDVTRAYERCPRRYALASAVCAVGVYSVTERSVFDTPHGRTSAVHLSGRLIRAALHARAQYDHAGSVDLDAVLLAFYLSVATFQQKEDNQGWYYLREAATLLQSAGWHREETYERHAIGGDQQGEARLSDEQLLRTRIVYFLVSISERAASIHRNLPITLDHAIKFPDFARDWQRGSSVRQDPHGVNPQAEPGGVLHSFYLLHRLFAPFDARYTSFRDTGTLGPGMGDLIGTSTDVATAADLYVLDLHARVLDAVPTLEHFTARANFSPAVVADLLVTRQWLLIRLYRVAIARNLLAWRAPEHALGLLYPIAVARDLVRVRRALPPGAFEVHGGSMLEKFYDVAVTLADLVQVVPLSTFEPPVAPATRTAHVVRARGDATATDTGDGAGEGFGTEDLLHVLVALVGELRREHNLYLPKLLERLRRLTGRDTDAVSDVPVYTKTTSAVDAAPSVPFASHTLHNGHAVPDVQKEADAICDSIDHGPGSEAVDAEARQEFYDFLNCQFDNWVAEGVF